MKLRLRTKVFLGLFILASVMTITSGYIFYRFQVQSIKTDFINSHNSIAEVISNNLKQAENLTDQLMLNAALGLEEVIYKRVPSKSEFQALRDKYKVTDLYLIDNKGVFVESTDDFAQTSTYNFFNFCESYKGLVEKPYAIDQTPILLAHPPNNEKPYKFTHLTTRNLKHIVEVGIHLSYIQDVLKTSLQNYPSITNITLKTPAGQVLGKIDSGLTAQDSIKLNKRVEANDTQCCQCKTKKLTSGQYYYDLDFLVSLDPVNKELRKILNLIILIEAILIILCLFLSHLISKSVLRKFEKLTVVLDNISATGELTTTEVDLKDKDIKSITTSFNRMISKLIEKENKLIESEIHKAKYDLSNQVAHDIRSPLESLKGLKAEIGPLPESTKKKVQLIINRIEEITFNLLKLKNDQKIEDTAKSNPEELQSLISSVLIEKSIEYRNLTNLEILSELNEKSYGLFSSINRASLKSILSNILNNAAEALPQKQGQIKVRLLQNGSHNLIEIEDNGPGISKDVQPNLFNKGFTTKEAGNGLGLYQAKAYLEKNQGSIEFETSSSGTVFRIKLLKSEPSLLFVKKINIFLYKEVIVLDDDPTFHEVWKSKLARTNIKITNYYSAVEMLKDIKTIPPTTLLLSDYETMDENLNGLQAILRLNNIENSILVTARNEESKIQAECSAQNIKLLPKSMIEFVEINTTKPFVVLIDDERLVHIDWFNYFQELEIDFKSYYKVEDFISDSANIPKDALIYIDSNLGNGIRGEIEAEKIFKLDFGYLHITTGYDPKSIIKPPYIKSIVGKSANIIF